MRVAVEVTVLQPLLMHPSPAIVLLAARLVCLCALEHTLLVQLKSSGMMDLVEETLCTVGWTSCCAD